MAGFVPRGFRCRKHPDLDLTRLVKEEVEREVRVASLNFKVGRKRPMPFRVRVTCPGAGADEHPLEFSGSYEP